MLAHSVYFTLKDPSDEAKARLVAACHEKLSGHTGTVFFAAGTLASELNRPVNARDFDVALVVVFENREAHDAYQSDSRHLAFIEENQENWKQVRVFDAHVSGSPS